MINIKGSNVTIMVKNMNTAIEFYQAIGLNLKQRWDDHYAMVETSGITIGIHPASVDEVNSGTVSIGFMIDKMEDAKALLDSNKVVYKAEDDGKSGNYLHFKDPDGTILYFVQPKW
jgi:catechol 2,3-dioxygenase-like lactoylglutathione lyase family enzyme